MNKHKGEFHLIGKINSEVKIVNYQDADALEFILLVSTKTKENATIESLYTITHKIKNVNAYLPYLKKGKFIELTGDVQIDSKGNILKSLETTSLTFLN